MRAKFRGLGLAFQSSGVPVRLDSGEVLVIGGYGRYGAASADVIRLDPAKKTSRAASPMAVARLAHTATLLADGRVLVTGGTDRAAGDATFDSAEIYDPATDRWSNAPPLSAARKDHTATLLRDGRVLVVAGRAGRFEEHYEATAEIFDPALGRWSSAGALAIARYRHAAALLPDGRVFIVGGFAARAANGLKGAELFEPTCATWSSAGDGHHLYGRPSATALRDGRILITDTSGNIGVLSQGSEIRGSIEGDLYSATAGWHEIAHQPDVGERSPTLAPLADGRAIRCAAVGVFGASDRPTECHIYDPTRDRWIATPGPGTARSPDAALRLPEGILYTGPAGVILFE